MHLPRRRTDGPTHVLEDHHHLQQRLRELQSALSDERMDRQTLQSLASRLSRELADHFLHEEQGGLFADTVERAPHLHERAQSLLSEHVRMSSQFHQLEQLLRWPGVSVSWRRELMETFQSFYDSYLVHEAKENSLLQESFGDDIAAGD